MSIQPSSLTLMDTHCHLDYIQAGLYGHDSNLPLSDAVQKAYANGVKFILNPSVSIADFDRVLAVAEQFSYVYAGIGLHPCEAGESTRIPNWETQIISRLAHPKVKALGETGLDYYHQIADSELAHIQRHCFEKHLQWGATYNLPLIIHDREAHNDIMSMVDAYPDAKGVMHCFGGDAEFALEMVNRGYMISFAGNVTFKKATALQEAARSIPLEYLLVETDSPFLSPVPERGRPNEPYRTRFVAEFIANLRDISIETLAKATTDNAFRFFRLPAELLNGVSEAHA
jgi:TatD DNase family protein